MLLQRANTNKAVITRQSQDSGCLVPSVAAHDVRTE